MVAILYNSNNVIRMNDEISEYIWWSWSWFTVVTILEIRCHFTAPLSFYESLT